MLDIILGLVPVFALIVLGAGVARTPLLTADGWAALERMTYFVLFPALLFESIVSAKLQGGEAGRLAVAVIVADLALAAAALAARPFLKMSGASFSSVFQGVVRWNSYVSFGIVSSLYGDRGLGLAAVVAAVLIPLNNVMSVTVMARYAGGKPASLGQTLRGVALNPLIIATVSGGLLLVAGLKPPSPVLETMELMGQATIALGLLCVGAALDLGQLRRSGVTVATTSLVRLVAAPAAAFAAAVAIGLAGAPVAVAVICLGTPLATSSYILARQLGGDATLAANLVTATTLLSAVTLPLVIALAT